MPLKEGSDPATIEANIKQLMAEGYTQQQAIAIAMDKAKGGAEVKNDYQDCRSSGKCIDCESEPAVTNDGKLCLKCLKARINEMNPPEPPRQKWASMRGYKSRDMKTIAGQAEMLGDGDDPEDDL